MLDRPKYQLKTILQKSDFYFGKTSHISAIQKSDTGFYKIILKTT